MTRDDLKAALADPQIAAFLHVIREGESNQNDDAYTLINGGTHFSSFADHPYAHQAAPPGKAAGAYQFIPHTWDGLVARYGFTNFSPQCQDEGAVGLILEHYAGDAIKAGNIAQACQILASTWVSLPALGTTKAERTFVKFGGTLPVTQEQGATVADSTTAPSSSGADTLSSIANVASGIAPFLGPWGVLAGAAIKAFSPLLQEKLQKTLEKHTDTPEVAQTVAGNVIQAIQDATGKSDPVEAVVAVRNDPAAAQQAEQTVNSKLDELAPLLDKIEAGQKQAVDLSTASADAASARSGTPDLRPMLARNIWVAVMILAILLGAAIVAEIILKDDHKPESDLMVSFTGMVTYLLARLGDVYGWGFGGVQKNEAGAAVQEAIK